MKDARSIVRHFRKRDISWALGVSEAVGTVLLLGISVALAGFVALWTSQIDEGEEGIYVDLWASVQGNNLVVTHRGGDVLKGTGTFIIIRNSDGTEFLRNSYYTLTALNDDSWAPSEVLTIDITGVSAGFDVIITTERPSGGQTVILKNEMAKTSSAAGLPDLAITQVQLQNTNSKPVTRLNDEGLYLIFVRIDNFGADMTVQYFAEEAGNIVRNLRLFDSTEDLTFIDLEMRQRDVSVGAYINQNAPNFGIMESGDWMEVVYYWNKQVSDPRTLGVHTLNVKVVPFYQGEVNYRNNYVERKFRVDKLVRPLPIFGPDPGIYDISFSNQAPNSGEMITVTVIIQNSGDQPLHTSNGTHLVVSTYKPEIHSAISAYSYDWIVDYAGHEGKFRSQASPTTHKLVNDTVFPTCVITNITLLPGAYFFYYFTLEARVDVPGGLQWVYATIDVYDNPFHLEGIPSENGDDTGDNFGLKSIQVLPRILLVDDDEAPTGSNKDMTSSVLESLVGSGVKVDRMYIAQNLEDSPGKFRDAPAFDYDQTTVPAPKMKDYDIVIWVTGYVDDPFTNVKEAPGPIYGGNIQELMKFLETDRYVFIVGNSPFEGLTNKYFIDGNPMSQKGGTNASEYQAAKEFIYKYMGIKKIYNDQDLTSSAPYVLKGLDNAKLTPFVAGDYTLNLLDQTPGNKRMQLYTPRQSPMDDIVGVTTPVEVLTVPSELLSVPPKVNSLRSAEDPDPAHSGAQWRTIVLGWDINQIKYLNEKVNLFASILKWFDWKINVGRDLAITKMELFILTDTGLPEPNRWAKVKISETNFPKYLDTILIEATVRNNGPNSESTSATFYVTGPDGVELPVASNIPDPRTGLPETQNTPPYNNPTDINGIQKDGGEVTIYKLWLAVGVGKYTFKVVADPYHLIQEISEDNNDITYSTSTQTSFVTQNNILLVDDDGSTNNFLLTDPQTAAALAADPTKEILYPNGEPIAPFHTVLSNLGYDHEQYIVKQKYEIATTSWNFNTGLSVLDLKRYNSVIWVTGDAGNRGLPFLESLTINDMIELTKYLNGQYAEAAFLPPTHHENLMIVGSDWTFELHSFRANPLTGTSINVGEFMDTYLGLDPNFVPASGAARRMVSGVKTGQYISDIYLGLEYPSTQFDRDFRWREMKMASAEPYQDIRAGLYADAPLIPDSDLVSVQFELARNVVPFNYFKTISHSWQMWNAKFNTMETALHELLYMSLHAFNTPEDRPELIGRNVKISFENDNPVLGNSYLVKVEIANIGGKGGGGTVRFSDGSTLIKSENIYLEPNKATTLEAIWTPLYAGIRTFQVYLDYYNDYKEVFETLNNVPKLTREVYFFWDDMEGGTGNWDTDSTIVMINGEGRLDYMEEPTTSNIENNWGEMSGFNLNKNVNNPNVKKEFSSSNVSFMMHEPNAEIKTPIDVVMVVDTSGSMSGTKIADARTAAKTFVDQMGDLDRMALYRFQEPSIDTEAPLKVMDYTYMTAANKVTAKNIINTFPANSNTPIWDTIGEAITYAWVNRVPGRTPSVVALTDGDDYGTSNYETGSETYAPGSEPGETYIEPAGTTWGRADGTGLKWGDPEKQYRNQDGTAGHDIRRYYGSYSWRNMPDDTHETRTGLIHAPVYVFSIGLGISPRDTTYVNGGSTPPSQPWSRFTTEYNLWQIAHTSSYQGIGRGKYYYAPTSSELQTIYDNIYKEIQDLAQQATRGDTRAPLETLYYKLDEGAGLFANDASGNGLHGTLTSAQWTTGLIGGGGLDFQANNMISVADSPLLNQLDIYKRSFSFWINADDTVARQVIYRQGDSGGDGMVIYIQDNRIYAGFWSPGFITTTFMSMPFSDTLNWHYVVFTFDSSIAAQVMFLDNIPSGNAGQVGYIDMDSGDVRIGRSGINTLYAAAPSPSNSNNHLDGELDDFRIYNSVLDLSDIQEFYEQGLRDKNGIRAEYYSYTGGSPSYETLRVIQFENAINYNWGNGALMPGYSDRVVVRWTGYVLTLYSEIYTFYARTDDGARVFVNDIRIINDWRDKGVSEVSGTINLQGNKLYKLVFEYYENNGDATAQLSWSSASQAKQIIPADKLYLSKYSSVAGVGGEGGGGGSSEIDPKNPWTDGSTTNANKWLLTKPIDLRNVDESMLSFYQKYNLKVGSNGGVIQIGTADNDLLPNGGYHFRYIQPDQPYTGNTLTSQWSSNLDDYGTPMRWAWNGKSGGGTMGWDYITVNLNNFAGHYVRIKFLYIANYGGTGYGWMIDDVKVTVSSKVHSTVKNDTLDNWNIKVTDDKDSLPTQAWFCGDDAHFGGDFKNGIDNSLYTRPIDLTNARTAVLSADLKFNIEEASGRPPDGFRVEVSTDNGVKWIPLNLGVRTSWGVSGTQPDISDGIIDGKSFTGLPSGNGWVRIDTLSRCIVNLDGFIGNTIILRFRVVTNIDNRHYENGLADRGLYLDNMIIYGESLEGGRGSEDPLMEEYLNRVMETHLPIQAGRSTEAVLRTEPTRENLPAASSGPEQDGVEQDAPPRIIIIAAIFSVIAIGAAAYIYIKRK